MFRKKILSLILLVLLITMSIVQSYASGYIIAGSRIETPVAGNSSISSENTVTSNEGQPTISMVYEEILSGLSSIFYSN